MASRKEQKERLRAERLAQEASVTGSDKRRLYVGYGVAGILALVVVGALIAVVASSGNAGLNTPAAAHVQEQSGTVPPHAVFDTRKGTPPPAIQYGSLQQAAKVAGCTLQLNLPNEGRQHLQPGQPPPHYGTNPPTSGNHITAPLQTADGAYRMMPIPEYFLHSLEHGRIEIQYSPKLPEAEQLDLKGVFDSSPDGMLMFPNTQMPYLIATTAWTQLMGCQKYSPAVLDAIRDFRDIYRGNGPETQVPLSF